MATAVSRLIAVMFPIFLLLVATAAAARDSVVSCHNIGGGDAGTAASLVRDLPGEVPARPNQRYCNVQVMTSGWNMYGFGYCTTRGRTEAPSEDCSDCLTRAGNDLINDCGGAGEVWGPNALCYILTGLTNKCA